MRIRFRQRRLAFTLLELVAVMTLVVLLAALGMVMIPSARDRSVNLAADRIQGWMLIAKQRARRDGLATGLRLIADADDKVRKLQYLQQPDDFSAPYTTCQCAGGRIVTFAPGANPEGQPIAVNLATANVHPGDVIEFFGAGSVYPILKVDSAKNRLVLAVNGPDTTGNAVIDYRILRRPIPLIGEDVLELPDDAILDPAQSLNVPVGRSGFAEVLFSPHGGLVGQGTSSNDIVALWVQNERGDPKLLTVINPHTGFISVQQIGPAANPFQYCRDARASGL